MSTTSGGPDGLVDAGLVAAGAAIAVGAAARGAAGAACAMGSCRVGAGAGEGLARIIGGRSPAAAWAAPGMSGALFWVVLVVEAAGIIAVGLWAWRRFGGGRQRRHTDPRNAAGMATGAQVREHFSARAMERMTWLRPDLARPRAADLAIRVGTARGGWVWVPIEDSISIAAPSRSGKSRYLVIPIVAEYPGAVLTTSVRAETAAATVLARSAIGPVAVFAPEGISVGGAAGKALRASTIRWSLTRGCEDTETAQRRARALVANGGAKGASNAEFWDSNARQALAPMLHAAALGGRGAADLARWASRPGLANEAVQILRACPGAAPGWADALEAVMAGDERTVSNVWATIGTAVREPLMNPAVVESISPGPGDELDIEGFIARRGTLYIVSDAMSTSAPLVAALVEDVYAAAMRAANRAQGNRLCPPVGGVLDEINNIAVLPSLPAMMSAGGGSGWQTIVVEQSRAQSAARLGRETAAGIYDSATTKIILGGATARDTLDEISAAVGERDVRRRTVSDGRGLGEGRSTSWAEHEERILTGAQVRELPKGTALVLKAGAPAVIVAGHELGSRERGRHRQAPVGRAPERVADTGPTSTIPAVAGDGIEEE